MEARDLILRAKGMISDEIIEWNQLCQGAPKDRLDKFANEMNEKYYESARFRVLNSGDPVFKANSTEEIYQWLKKNPLYVVGYTIGCIVDNVDWIQADEFVESFHSGECPGDLQFF